MSRSLKPRPLTIGRSSVAEVSGIGGRVLRGRPIARLDRRIADDLERPPAQLARAVRQARRPADAAHLGQRADVATHRVVELCDRFRGWIP